MSVFDQKIASQFYLTASQPCPYLPGREERKIFTTLRGPGADRVNHELSLRGFRRSQNVVYRPSCRGCAACMSVRAPTARFTPSKNQKRVMRRNADLERVVCSAWATEEQHALFTAYLDARHADGGMSGMDGADFAAMIEDSPVSTRLIEYRLEEGGRRSRLVACCLTDVTPDGLSMVYSFYDPALSRRSLGAFMILDHIALAQSLERPHVYLGYWVQGSEKMAYKARFRPLEGFINGAWRPLDETTAPVRLFSPVEAI